ncbi:hypothetical protein HQ865_01610 [Mucilaginibacter mali]|uniref:Uncharacterized protein n=1 Tax=Mucilaginibacter mali TaxID=2740462 RepID=A0A7D4PRU7_9SPHI|nr:hypothetical protein [Mucilaginibacter mali]QKJ28508.1 hypothetical protein HQ865_01610 [Mucilaginibacter mali]
MNTFEFVTGMIDKIVDNFPFIQCRYQYDNFDNSHFVEVLPAKYLQECDDLTLMRNSFIIDFIKKFPSESLTFVTDGDLIELDDIIYLKQGKGYKLAKMALDNHECLEFPSDDEIEIFIEKDIFTYQGSNDKLSIAA